MNDPAASPVPDFARASWGERACAALLLGGALGGWYALVRIYVPSVRPLFESLKVDLPAPAKLTLAIATTELWVALALAGLVLAVICWRTRRAWPLWLLGGGLLLAGALAYTSLEVTRGKILEALRRQEERGAARPGP